MSNIVTDIVYFASLRRKVNGWFNIMMARRKRAKTSGGGSQTRKVKA